MLLYDAEGALCSTKSGHVSISFLKMIETR
jgi:hypothetical protein